jgi:hypothetical protein
MANHDDFSHRALLGAMMSVSPALAGAARTNVPAGAAVPPAGNAEDGQAMFLQAGTGATRGTIEDKLGERVTPPDFGRPATRIRAQVPAPTTAPPSRLRSIIAPPTIYDSNEISCSLRTRILQ